MPDLAPGSVRRCFTCRRNLPNCLVTLYDRLLFCGLLCVVTLLLGFPFYLGSWLRPGGTARCSLRVKAQGGKAPFRVIAFHEVWKFSGHPSQNPGHQLLLAGLKVPRPQEPSYAPDSATRAAHRCRFEHPALGAHHASCKPKHYGYKQQVGNSLTPGAWGHIYIICFSSATKIVQFIHKLDLTYVCMYITWTIYIETAQNIETPWSI